MGEATDDWAALQLALDLHRDPWGVRYVRRQPLPTGTSRLLAVAAGDAESQAAAAERLGRPHAAIREAATFFIEQILLAPGADSYRVLGARPAAAASELRHNMALLMSWLHPDVASEGERSVFAARIAAAWNTLKTPERRAAYDRDRIADTAGHDARAAREVMARRSRRRQRAGASVRRKSRLPRFLAFWLLGKSRY